MLPSDWTCENSSAIDGQTTASEIFVGRCLGKSLQAICMDVAVSHRNRGKASCVKPDGGHDMHPMAQFRVHIHHHGGEPD